MQKKLLALLALVPLLTAATTWNDTTILMTGTGPDTGKDLRAAIDAGDLSVIRSAADCLTQTDGRTDDVCVDSTAGGGTGLWRCPLGPCNGTTAWERIDGTGAVDDIYWIGTWTATYVAGGVNASTPQCMKTETEAVGQSERNCSGGALIDYFGFAIPIAGASTDICIREFTCVLGRVSQAMIDQHDTGDEVRVCLAKFTPGGAAAPGTAVKATTDAGCFLVQDADIDFFAAGEIFTSGAINQCLGVTSILLGVTFFDEVHTGGVAFFDMQCRARVQRK